MLNWSSSPLIISTVGLILLLQGCNAIPNEVGKLMRDPFYCPSDFGSYPNPDDCGSFYVCSNGDAILIKCPPGLVYNPATELCDYVYNVPSCNEPQTTSSTTSTRLPITTTENNCIAFPDSIECQTTLMFSTEESSTSDLPPESTSDDYCEIYPNAPQCQSPTPPDESTTEESTTIDGIAESTVESTSEGN